MAFEDNLFYDESFRDIIKDYSKRHEHKKRGRKRQLKGTTKFEFMMLNQNSGYPGARCSFTAYDIKMKTPFADEKTRHNANLTSAGMIDLPLPNELSDTTRAKFDRDEGFDMRLDSPEQAGRALAGMHAGNLTKKLGGGVGGIAGGGTVEASLPMRFAPGMVDIFRGMEPGSWSWTWDFYFESPSQSSMILSSCYELKRLSHPPGESTGIIEDAPVWFLSITGADPIAQFFNPNLQLRMHEVTVGFGETRFLFNDKYPTSMTLAIQFDTRIRAKRSDW